MSNNRLCAEYEQQLAMLQTLLEPSQLQACWEQGRAMSRGEAIRDALQQPEVENR